MDYSEEFPFDQFPWKLVHKEGKETRKCYFQTEDHMKKHITRCNLKKKDYTIGYKYAEGQ
jgi:hypothetical protein